jgi:group I intron endonuclease
MARCYKINVYYAKNIANNKIYIGQSKYGWATAKTRHKRKALVLGCKSPFYDAIREFGFDMFEWGVLKECESKEESELFERRHIELIGLENCYNANIGGTRNFELSDDTKKILSEQKLGIKNPMYGRILSDETRSKLLQLSMEVCSKPVIRLSDGKVYPSISECARQNNLAIASISLHVNNKLKSQRFKFVE